MMKNLEISQNRLKIYPPPIPGVLWKYPKSKDLIFFDRTLSTTSGYDFMLIFVFAKNGQKRGGGALKKKVSQFSWK